MKNDIFPFEFLGFFPLVFLEIFLKKNAFKCF